MNPESTADQKNRANSGEAESTLRLIAGLAAPEGLEARVKTALTNKAGSRRSATLFDWPLSPRGGWMRSTFVRSAAAASIVCVVAGGSWGVYRHVQPKEVPMALPHVGAPSGFSSANAMRTPKTLDGPTLTHPVRTHSVTDEGGQTAGSAKKRPEAKKKAAGKAAVTKPAQQ